MDEKDIKAVIEDACCTLEAAAEMVSTAARNPETGAPPPAKDHVASAATALKSSAAKIGFMFSQPEKPSGDAATSLVISLRDAATMLCMVLASVATNGSGPTLQKALQSATMAILEAHVALLRGVAAATSPASASSGAANLVKLAGMCMERCDDVAKGPMNDKTAIGRALAVTARQLLDAATEVASEAALSSGDSESAAPWQVVRFADASTQAPVSARLLSEGVDGWLRSRGVDAMLLIPEVAENGLSSRVDAYIAHPRPAVPSDGVHCLNGSGLVATVTSEGRIDPGAAALLCMHRVFDTSAKLVQEAMRILLRCEMTPSDVERWESVLFHAKHLQAAVDDLAAAGYEDELDVEEIGGAVEAVVVGCEQLWEEAMGGAEENDAAITLAGAKGREVLGVIKDSAARLVASSELANKAVEGT